MASHVFTNNDRTFEVHAARFYKGGFMLWNVAKDDLVRERDNSTHYFESIESALNFADGEKVIPSKTKKERTPRVKGESALQLMKTLIREGVLTDPEILAKVQEKATGYKHVSIIKYVRKQMEAKGELKLA